MDTYTGWREKRRDGRNSVMVNIRVRRLHVCNFSMKITVVAAILRKISSGLLDKKAPIGNGNLKDH